jgi:hypothetical protein
VELVEQLVPADAEGLGRAVQIQAVPRLVLDLGHEDGLAAQRGRARDPVGLRLHADDLGVGVLRYLADQRRAVGVGHPVARLDALVGGHGGVEGRLVRIGADGVGGAGLGAVRLCAGRLVGGCCRHEVPFDLGSAGVGAPDRSFGSCDSIVRRAP